MQYGQPSTAHGTSGIARNLYREGRDEVPTVKQDDFGVQKGHKCEFVFTRTANILNIYYRQLNNWTIG